MLKSEYRNIADHEVLEIQTAKSYRPYDRLILRDSKGKRIWTVLACERADQGWTVTGIRCPRGCRIHRRRR